MTKTKSMIYCGLFTALIAAGHLLKSLYLWFRLHCSTCSLCLPDHIGVRFHEIHIKKIKQNPKFYKRNIKYLAKAYHK